MSAPLPEGEGLYALRLRVSRPDVALARYLLEARDHLALLHGSGDGTLTLLTPLSRAGALAEFVADLATEIEVEELGQGPCEGAINSGGVKVFGGSQS